MKKAKKLFNLFVALLFTATLCISCSGAGGGGNSSGDDDSESIELKAKDSLKKSKGEIKGTTWTFDDSASYARQETSNSDSDSGSGSSSGTDSTSGTGTDKTDGTSGTDDSTGTGTGTGTGGGTDPVDPSGTDDSTGGSSEPATPTEEKEEVKIIYLHVDDEGKAYFGEVTYEETKVNGKVTNTSDKTYKCLLKGKLETKSYDDGDTAYSFYFNYENIDVKDVNDNNTKKEAWYDWLKSQNGTTKQYGLYGAKDPCKIEIKKDKSKMTIQHDDNASDFTQFFWNKYEYNEKMKGPSVDAKKISIELKDYSLSIKSTVDTESSTTSDTAEVVNFLSTAKIADSIRACIACNSDPKISIKGDSGTTYYEGNLKDSAVTSASFRWVEGQEDYPVDYPIPGEEGSENFDGAGTGTGPAAGAGTESSDNSSKTFGEVADTTFKVYVENSSI